MYYSLLTGTVNTSISQLLTDADAIFDKMVEWIPEGLNLILANPVLFIPVAIGIIGSAFGILSRVFHRS